MAVLYARLIQQSVLAHPAFCTVIGRVPCAILWGWSMIVEVLASSDICIQSLPDFYSSFSQHIFKSFLLFPFRVPPSFGPTIEKPCICGLKIRWRCLSRRLRLIPCSDSAGLGLESARSLAGSRRGVLFFSLIFSFKFH